MEDLKADTLERRVEYWEQQRNAAQRHLSHRREVPTVWVSHPGAHGSAPKGNRNAVKHGHYTAEAIKERQYFNAVTRLARDTLREVDGDCDGVAVRLARGRWEYMRHRIEGCTVTELCELGRQGWLLCAIEGEMGIFARDAIDRQLAEQAEQRMKSHE